MRKVKFTQQTISERLGAIVSDFPRLDDVHPFHGDLMGVLYDRDSGRSLCQIRTPARSFVKRSSGLRATKSYADSLYRCTPQSGRIGDGDSHQRHGRPSLPGEVRKHLGRLLALDPTACTCYAGSPTSVTELWMVTRADGKCSPASRPKLYMWAT